MASVSTATPRKTQAGYPAHSRRFDTIMGLLTLLLTIGLFIDGWAHNQGMVDESFFTPYHAVMYSSYGLFGMTLVSLHFYNVNRGYTFRRALPKGYFLSLIGIFIFAVGGFLDMLWHEAFGIEEGIEALYSPSHMLLFIGYTTVILGVIYSAWVRRETMHGWRDLWWVMLASACLLSILTFATQFMGFVNNADGMIGFPRDRDLLTTAVIASYVIATSIMIGLVLMLMRRWRLPFGTVTAMFALNSTLMGLMYALDPALEVTASVGIIALIVIPATFGGIVADILIWRLKVTPRTPNAVRVITTVTPFVIGGAYVAATHVLGLIDGGGGLWWEIHTWLGVPTLCAVAGLLLSVMVFPPAIPDAAVNE